MTRGEVYSSVSEESRLQYEQGSFNADARRALYRFAEKPYDVWGEAIDHLLPLKGNEWGLDIGTGSGFFVERLWSKIQENFPGGYEGSILGIDKYPRNYMATWQALVREHPFAPVQFGSGDAENLFLPNDCLDFATFLHVGYHLDDPKKPLTKLEQIIKPGGKLIVATRGSENLERLWRLGDLTADKVNATKPRHFYQSFDFQSLGQYVPASFRLEYQHIENSYLKIPLDVETPNDRKGWEIFSNALFSLRDSMFDKEALKKGIYVPANKEVVQWIINTDIWGIFTDELARKSQIEEGDPGFTLTAQQGIFVYVNAK